MGKTAGEAGLGGPVRTQFKMPVNTLTERCSGGYRHRHAHGSGQRYCWR